MQDQSFAVDSPPVAKTTVQDQSLPVDLPPTANTATTVATSHGGV